MTIDIVIRCFTYPRSKFDLFPISEEFILGVPLVVCAPQVENCLIRGQTIRGTFLISEHVDEEVLITKEDMVTFLIIFSSILNTFRAIQIKLERDRKK